MSRALAGRLALRQMVAPAAPRVQRLPRFLSLTTAQRSDEPPSHTFADVFEPTTQRSNEKQPSSSNPSTRSATAERSDEPQIPSFNPLTSIFQPGTFSPPTHDSQLPEEELEAYKDPDDIRESSSEYKQTNAGDLDVSPLPRAGSAVTQSHSVPPQNYKKIARRLYGERQVTATPIAEAARYDRAGTKVFWSLNRPDAVNTSVLLDPEVQDAKVTVVDPNPHHLHVYAHKHNCHITFTRPNCEPVISVSCGNIGFRKSNRGLFDAAYTLAKYVLERLKQKKLKINQLELVLRGFGEGRLAMVKILQTHDGAFLREKIIRISDSTRLKFGGCRSPRQRRL
ncbi:hypothetical protein CDD80_6416 [Ophiocordyceps camponoti-rufipedis]|uniref:Ribosomal protein S11 n=1 Tax=Ophiocordyceps camponoti-rufipedis TaxID=2004952 RepID=A0A2C5ZIK4_9HYPO|nr:hypothetical protein CDD80_6416 [Ophiocordyceps camponoti-rufipedis]